MGLFDDFPFMSDPNVSDPRYDSTWKHLYDDWKWPEDKIRDFLADPEQNPWTGDANNAANNEYLFYLSLIPGVSEAVRMADNVNKFFDYMENTGLTWEDIIYPGSAASRFGLAGGAGVGFDTLNWTSSNLERLYRM